MIEKERIKALTSVGDYFDQARPYTDWWTNYQPWFNKLNAQHLWLDKILELAIESGLVALEEERG